MRPRGPETQKILGNLDNIYNWRNQLGELGRKCETALEAFQVLCGAARGGPTRLGSFELEEFDASFSSPTQDTPSVRHPELLPLPEAASARHLALWKNELSDWYVSSTAFELSKSVVHCLNFLGCAGWTSKPIRIKVSSVLTAVQKHSLRHIWETIVDFIKFEDFEFSIDELRTELLSKIVNYSGEVVSVRRQIVCSKVLPAWPKAGEACILPAEDFITEELKDDLMNPKRCLLPESDWPKVPPKSKVHATDDEWYSLVKEGSARGIFGEVSYEQVFMDFNGKPVLNGAMGVDKFKVVEGKTVELLRFICILVPINSYLRKLRGDSNLLPFLPQVTLITLEPNEVMYTDSEDMMSCFNLFKMPDCWAGYLHLKSLSLKVHSGEIQIR